MFQTLKNVSSINLVNLISKKKPDCSIAVVFIVAISRTIIIKIRNMYC